MQNQDYQKHIIAAFMAAGLTVERQDVPGNAFYVRGKDKPNCQGVEATLVISKSSCNLISSGISVSFDRAEQGSPESISAFRSGSVSLFRRGDFAGQLFI